MAKTKTDPSSSPTTEFEPTTEAPAAPAASAPSEPVRPYIRPFFSATGKFRADQGSGPAAYVDPEMGGLAVRHLRYAKKVFMVDPWALRVPKKNKAGRTVYDDPYLALPKPDGTEFAIRQVRFDHAAELLSCDELNGGQSLCRLATAEEIEEHRFVHHRGHAEKGGSHGNILQNAEE